MRRLFLAIALMCWSAAAHAQAGCTAQNFPANNIAGRLGAGQSGPCQPIPLNNLAAALFGSSAGAGGVRTSPISTTVVSTDCGGTIILSGAFTTLTWPAANTLPNWCPVDVWNLNTSRGQAFSGLGISFIAGMGGAGLYPGQSITVAAVNGAYGIKRLPGRWRVQSAPTINVSTSGTDNNDGLDAGAPLRHAQTGLNVVQGDIDFGPNLLTNATIQLAAGTYSECLTWFGPLVGTENVTLQGNTGAPTSYIISCSNSQALHVKDGGATITLVGLELSTSHNGDSALLVEANGAADLNTVDLVSNGAGGTNAMLAQGSGANITIVGPVTAASSVNSFYSSTLGAMIYINGNVTVNNGVTLAVFGTANGGGQIFQSPTNTITNNGTVTAMCGITLNGVVQRNSVTWPGAVCTPATGGQLE